ncbi:hypothetical protein ACSNNV_14350, partial [Faecalibacterium prausnitzii]|uniref:hypothetical protein n=1 Tax=Faecalibacterium prausnitzii TaxID=853 RepID=UPI003F1B56C6
FFGLLASFAAAFFRLRSSRRARSFAFSFPQKPFGSSAPAGFSADVPQRLPLLAQFHVSLFLCKAFSCPP